MIFFIIKKAILLKFSFFFFFSFERFTSDFTGCKIAENRDFLAIKAQRIYYMSKVNTKMANYMFGNAFCTSEKHTVLN